MKKELPLAEKIVSLLGLILLEIGESEQVDPAKNKQRDEVAAITLSYVEVFGWTKEFLVAQKEKTLDHCYLRKYGAEMKKRGLDMPRFLKLSENKIMGKWPEDIPTPERDYSSDDFEVYSQFVESHFRVGVLIRAIEAGGLYDPREPYALYLAWDHMINQL